MKHLIWIMVLSSWVSQAQVTKHYFKDEGLTRETKREKASYEVTISKEPDGSFITTVRDTRRNQVISSENNFGEPIGLIQVKTGWGKAVLDYDFKLNYKDTLCGEGSISMQVRNPMADHDSLHYIAPKLDGYKAFTDLLMKNLRYPDFARENGISGKTFLRFTITKEGWVENISVVKTVHPSIDKEAMRVLRMMRIKTPALIDGKETSVCITMPISFRLE